MSGMLREVPGDWTISRKEKITAVTIIAVKVTPSTSSKEPKR